MNFRAALRLTVVVDESSQAHHRPVYAEIVHRAHAAGLAGATVVRGIEGFGSTQRIHTSRLLSLSENLPVVVLIVDDPEKVRAFLPVLEEIVAGGIVTIEDVQVARPGAEGGP
jgi:PII-like signaling protein